MGQESGHDPIGCLCLKVSRKTWVNVFAKAAVSSEGLIAEGSTAKLDHMIVSRIQLFLNGTKL